MKRRRGYDISSTLRLIEIIIRSVANLALRGAITSAYIIAAENRGIPMTFVTKAIFGVLGFWASKMIIRLVMKPGSVADDAYWILKNMIDAGREIIYRLANRQR